MSTPGERADDERPPEYRSPRRVQEPEPTSRSETQRDRDRIPMGLLFAGSGPGAPGGGPVPIAEVLAALEVELYRGS